MSSKSAEAGKDNLLKWMEKHPEGPRFRHGAYSRHFRKRYSDARTVEGKQLRGVISGLIADLGGMPTLTAGQLLILDRIKEKLVVLIQIGQYVDKQHSVITEAGELLPCLGRGYTSYSEALRRDVLALYEMAARKPSRTPDLAAYLERKKRESAE